MKKIVCSCLFISLQGVTSPSVNAESISADTLTIANSAHFGGIASFGYADGGLQGSGFTLDVFSGVVTIERENVTPGYWTNSTSWEDEWGWIDGQTQIIMCRQRQCLVTITMGYSRDAIPPSKCHFSTGGFRCIGFHLPHTGSPA